MLTSVYKCSYNSIKYNNKLHRFKIRYITTVYNYKIHLDVVL
jgi:hypothetical protein